MSKGVEGEWVKIMMGKFKETADPSAWGCMDSRLTQLGSLHGAELGPLHVGHNYVAWSL